MFEEYIKKSSAKSIILNAWNRREMIQELNELPTVSFPDREKECKKKLYLLLISKMQER